MGVYGKLFKRCTKNNRWDKYDFVNNFNKLSKKYVTGYLGTANVDNRVDNYTANKAMYGDAVWETSNGASGQNSWNNDYSYFPYLLYPFFLRGGYFNHSANAGVFYFYNNDGGTHGNYGFRVVVL